MTFGLAAIRARKMQRLARLREFARKWDLLYETHRPTNVWNGSSMIELNEVSVFSHDTQYRYAYVGRWSDKGPLILWVLINPGTAYIEGRRRPALESCVRLSCNWKKSAGGVVIANLFALLSEDVKNLRSMKTSGHDIVGPYNDMALGLLSNLADQTVVAWGNGGLLNKRRAAEICHLFRKRYCLGLTARSAAAPRSRTSRYKAHDVSMLIAEFNYVGIDAHYP